MVGPTRHLARAVGGAHVDGLPGPHDLAQPVMRIGRRIASLSSCIWAWTARRPRPPRSNCSPRSHPLPAERAKAYPGSSPRHAPARRHGDCTRLRPRLLMATSPPPASTSRPGADPRPSRLAPAERTWQSSSSPRPRRRGHSHRRDRRHVMRVASSRRRDQDTLRRHGHALHAASWRRRRACPSPALPARRHDGDPRPAQPPGLCFAPRCAYAQDRCGSSARPGRGDEPGHSYACWYPLVAARIPASGEPDQRPCR